MVKSDIVTFYTAFSVEEAKEISTILNKNNIHSIIEDNSLSFDASFANNNLDNNYFILKIHRNDFNKANNILEDIAKNNLKHIDDSHYLFSFNNKELIEILKNPDKWSKEDYLAAKNMLNKRGKKITKKNINDFKKDRIKKLRCGIKAPRIWIFLGLFSSVFGIAIFRHISILFLFASFFIGWFFWKFKQTDFEGNTYYVYRSKTRKAGFYIFLSAIICLIYKIIMYKTKLYQNQTEWIQQSFQLIQ